MWLDFTLRVPFTSCGKFLGLWFGIALDSLFRFIHTGTMSYTTKERSKIADSKSRDSHGHFAKKVSPEPNPSSSSNPSTQTVNPDSIGVRVQLDSSRQKTNTSDSLVSLNIKNPLAVFTRSLMKAINKPMTIKIPPLYAFPILIGTLGIIPLSFFGLGKQVEKEKIAALPTPTPIVIIQPTATPAPILISKSGTIRATYQVQYLLSPSPSPIPTVMLSDKEASQSATPTEIPPTPTPVPIRFVLVKGEDITFLAVPPDVNLANYLNRRVLITGFYDKTKDTLQISKSGDIEVLP